MESITKKAFREKYLDVVFVGRFLETLKETFDKLLLLTKSIDIISSEELQEPRLAPHIISAITTEPVEDGIYHPAQDILKSAIEDQPQETFNWIKRLLSDECNSSVVASVIKCLGRLNPRLCEGWLTDIIRTGLQHSDVEVRDSTVQAIENWEIKEAIPLLREHHEDVPWLKEYIQGVIEDIEALRSQDHDVRSQEDF
ncbi:MAG TPA: hypothetical protein ENF86_00300 [Firmicutes bacterium]|nr:hypothetical protein [Bacillota bacterium]